MNENENQKKERKNKYESGKRWPIGDGTTKTGELRNHLIVITM